MATHVAKAGQEYTGPENSARCHVRTWYLSSQGPQGGVMGGGRAPARQDALTAAVAANPMRMYQHVNLQRTVVSGAHAQRHAHTCGSRYGDAAVGRMQEGHAQARGEGMAKRRHAASHNWHTCRSRSTVTRESATPACPVCKLLLAGGSHSGPRRLQP